MAIEDLFTKTYSTKRFATSGGRSDLQIVIAESSCALQAASPNDPRFVGAGVYATHQVFISAADDVRTEDRMYIDGAEYVVIAVADPTGHGHHKEVHLEKKTKN
jgi:hypothetical protein